MDFLWLNSSGNIIYNTGYNHMSSIIDEPELFGVTRKLISETFKRYKEKTGTEGKARDYIMKVVMKQGWIRIRNNESYWIFETWNLTDEQKGSIYNFVMTKQVDRFSMIIVTQISTNTVDRYEDKKQFRKTFMTNGVELW